MEILLILIQIEKLSVYAIKKVCPSEQIYVGVLTIWMRFFGSW